MPRRHPLLCWDISPCGSWRTSRDEHSAQLETSHTLTDHPAGSACADCPCPLLGAAGRAHHHLLGCVCSLPLALAIISEPGTAHKQVVLSPGLASCNRISWQKMTKKGGRMKTYSKAMEGGWHESRSEHWREQSQTNHFGAGSQKSQAHSCQLS